MVTVQFLTNLDLPELQPYRTLRQPEEHFRNGIVVAEGEKVVSRLLESSLTVFSVLLTPEWLEVYQPRLEQRTEHIIAYCAPKSVLETIVGFHLHQGIMALAKVPPQPAFQDFVALAEKPFLFVALDGLTNAENVGVVVRNAAAFGAAGIVVGKTSSSPYLRRAVRNSMGAVFSLPVYHTPNLAATLQELSAAANCSLIAAHPHGETWLPSAHFKENVCVVFGSEGEGISSAVLEVCSEKVMVPMAHGVDSLNVASACAVFLYEVQRQRNFQRIQSQR